jgi:homoaconitase/3-isopropylmalate dehydratase large subunit
MRFVMDGEMPEYLLAKDLILQIIGEISVAGATYKAMEFSGSAIEGMNMDERMTICNMVVEAGSEAGGGCSSCRQLGVELFVWGKALGYQEQGQGQSQRQQQQQRPF